MPNATRIQALLALSQSKLGRGTEAEKTLKVLNTVDIKDPQSLLLLAQASKSIGDADLATAYITKAIKQNPEVAELHVALAGVLSNKGQRAEAIDQLENALQLDPGTTNADSLLIQNLVRDKQFGKALSAVEAMEKKERNPNAFNLKGIVYFGKKDIVNARKSFEQAAALETTTYYVQKNELRKALAIAQEAQAAKPEDPQALDSLGKAQLAAGERESAVITYTKLVSVQPRSPLAHFRLAIAYAATRNIDSAGASLTKALELKPDYLDAQILLASIEVAAGRHGEAQKLARHIQEAHPESAAGFLLQGEVLMAQNRLRRPKPSRRH